MLVEHVFRALLELGTLHCHGVYTVSVLLDGQPELLIEFWIAEETLAKLFWNRRAFQPIAVEYLFTKWRGDPGFAADKGADMSSGDALQGRHDLYRAGPGTDDANALILEVVAVP